MPVHDAAEGCFGSEERHLGTNALFHGCELLLGLAVAGLLAFVALLNLHGVPNRLLQRQQLS